jgi:hypothetical protein
MEAIIVCGLCAMQGNSRSAVISGVRQYFSGPLARSGSAHHLTGFQKSVPILPDH